MQKQTIVKKFQKPRKELQTRKGKEKKYLKFILFSFDHRSTPEEYYTTSESVSYKLGLILFTVH